MLTYYFDSPYIDTRKNGKHRNTTFSLTYLQGDGTGTLHLLSDQLLDVPVALNTHTAIKLYPGGISYLPDILDLKGPGASFIVNGMICGVKNVSIHGGAALILGPSGSTCESTPGNYSFDNVIVQSGGKLLSVDVGAPEEWVNLYGNVCTEEGASVARAGINIVSWNDSNGIVGLGVFFLTQL